MTSQRDKVKRFLELHHGNEPLLIPNPWDAGSARLLEWLGFKQGTQRRYLERASQGRAAAQAAFGAPPDPR